MRLETEDVAGLLKEYGLRTALKGGNPYRAKAYLTAAQNLKAAGQPLDALISNGALKTVPGVGDAIADIIVKLHERGTHPRLEEMRKEAPAALLDMLELPKIRPGDILKVRAAGFDDLSELETALREGKISPKALSPSLQRKILEGIDIRRQSEGKIHLHRASYLLEQAKASLEARRPDLGNITIAGDLRRCCELVGELRLVATGKEPRLEKVNGIELRICRPEDFGITLLYATGSESHLEELQHVAAKRRLVLSPQGLRKGKARLPTATEKDIYDALGLPFIPPELREGRGEVEKAGKSRLPVLVERRDVKGVLHAHTDQSDGVATLAQMAAACRDSGYGYLGITDHSQSAHYAGGLSEKEVARQQREIDRLNKRNAPFRIFKGIESDILPDGALDYPDEVLKTFDFVIASVHGQFRKDKAVQTRRIIKAVSNPYTTVLGHITGRQLLRRHGYDVDIEAILKACAAHGVAIEVNGHPWRLDLDWRWLDRALELGCLISLDPDAHSVAEIDNVRWAVAMARKGGVPKEKIINCMSADQFAQFLRRKSLH